MEVSNAKGGGRGTTFNVDLDKQFIPFWNGLMHLIGVIKNDVITMRYDWDNIIEECEDFEKSYMTTDGFCESCVFYQMPAFLHQVMKDARSQGISDCKVIARDNDIIYTFCRQQQRTRGRLRLLIVLLAILVLLVLRQLRKK